MYGGVSKIPPNNAKSLLSTWGNLRNMICPFQVLWEHDASIWMVVAPIQCMTIKMIYGVTIFIFVGKETVWHFSRLNDICQSFSHLDRAFKSSWRIWLSIGPVIVRYLIVVTKCKAISSDISLKKEAMTERKLKVSLKRFKYLAKTFMLYQAAVYFSSPSVRRLNVTHPFRSPNTDSPYTFPSVDSVFFK